MKKILFLLVLSCTFNVFAIGNYQAGKEKSTVCASCHGPTGVSTNPIWPSLAGQHASYLEKQLRDFKQNQTRSSPLMTSVVANLTDQDMKDLSLFYATQPLPKGITPNKYLALGEKLYRGGDFAKHITACIACHGPAGQGNAQAKFPVVSGQQADYTLQQLQAFKDKQRSNDLNSIMRDISARMDKDDMIAIAHYMAGLH